MMLGNEHSIFSNISNLYIFSEKSALHSCKIEVFVEGENVARGQEPHLRLVGWVHVHTVHVFGFLFTWAIELVVICMLKNGRYL